MKYSLANSNFCSILPSHQLHLILNLLWNPQSYEICQWRDISTFLDHDLIMWVLRSHWAATIMTCSLAITSCKSFHGEVLLTFPATRTARGAIRKCSQPWKWTAIIWTTTTRLLHGWSIWMLWTPPSRNTSVWASLGVAHCCLSDHSHREKQAKSGTLPTIPSQQSWWASNLLTFMIIPSSLRPFPKQLTLLYYKLSGEPPLIGCVHCQRITYQYYHWALIGYFYMNVLLHLCLQIGNILLPLSNHTSLSLSLLFLGFLLFCYDLFWKMQSKCICMQSEQESVHFWRFSPHWHNFPLVSPL